MCAGIAITTQDNVLPHVLGHGWTWAVQAAEARRREQASRKLAEDIKQYSREQHEQEAAKRSEQKAVREQLEAQVHETQRQRDEAAAQVRTMVTYQKAPAGDDHHIHYVLLFIVAQAAVCSTTFHVQVSNTHFSVHQRALGMYSL